MESAGTKDQCHLVTYLQRVGWCPSCNYSVISIVKSSSNPTELIFDAQTTIVYQGSFIIITSTLRPNFVKSESRGRRNGGEPIEEHPPPSETMFFTALLGYPLVLSSPGFSPRRKPTISNRQNRIGIFLLMES